MTRTAASKKDLVVLVADINIEFAIRGLLDRHESLGIRSLRTDIFRHPQKDPGCLRESHVFLRSRLNLYDHALVLFDREGCGQEETDREQLEAQVQDLLHQNGWVDRAAVIVFDPELEIWVWSHSPHVATELGMGNPSA